jgi:hypothetical protein
VVSGIGSGLGILLVGRVMFEKSLMPTWDTNFAECDLFFFFSPILQMGQRLDTESEKIK